ncbi:sugar O-acyltransferase (sialic acid O-acetyltransferase NeuD family) [Streptomyces calvus]
MPNGFLRGLRGRAPRELLVIGAGGMGRAIASLCARETDAAGRPVWNVLGFVDEDPRLHGAAVDGLPVLGGLPVVARHPGARLVVSICHVDFHGARRRIVETLGLPAHRYATIVHPTAVIDPSCTVGPGAVVMPQVCALPGGTVGAHAVVRPQTMMAADVTVRDYATVAAQVFLGRGVVVEEEAYVGAGTKVRERAVVGPRAVVGMGSLVLGPVPGHEVWAGSPLRRLGPAV